MFRAHWLRIQPFWGLHLVAIFDPRSVHKADPLIFEFLSKFWFNVKFNMVASNGVCQIKCMKCLGRSEQYDRMMDLTVEIDGDINTLEQALAQFTISETLAGADKYKCSRLVRLPILLI